MKRISLRGGVGAFALLVLALSGCAAPRPAPIPIEPPPTETELPDPEPVVPDVPSSEFPDVVQEMIEDGDYPSAEALVRSELESESSEQNEAQLTLLLAEILTNQGRDEEAIVQLCRVRGRDDGAESEAWDAISRIRSEQGDRLASLQARLIAFDRASESERDRRTSPLEREIERLSERELRAVAHEAAGNASYRLLLDEMERRREAERDGGEVVVDLLAPLSGKFANFGEAFRLGAILALERRDAAVDSSGATSPRVRFLERDTEGDLLTATRSARGAVLEDGAEAILGPLLSVTSIGAGTVAQAHRIPLLAPTATDPRVSEIGRYVLTLEPSPRELTEPLAEFSVEGLGNVRHGVLVARDGISERFEQAFREAVEELGGVVVVSVAFDPGESDFRRLIERFDEADVEAVYVAAGAADLEALAPQLEFYEFGRRILGNGGWTSGRALDAGNRALEGAIFSVEAAEDPSSAFTMRLGEAVLRRGGGEVSRFHVRGYQAMEALLASIDQGARDGEEIVELLRRREFWPIRPAGEEVQLLTFRDGVLGPASWATGFDLTPRERDEAVPEEGLPEDVLD